MTPFSVVVTATAVEATVSCPNGHVNPIGADVCAECGQSLMSEPAQDVSEEDTTAASGGPEPASPSSETELDAPATIPPPYASEPLTPAPPQEDTPTVPQPAVETNPSEPESEPEPATPVAPQPPPEPEEPPPPAAFSEPVAAPRMSGRSIAALVAVAAAFFGALRRVLKRRAARRNA